MSINRCVETAAPGGARPFWRDLAADRSVDGRRRLGGLQAVRRARLSRSPGSPAGRRRLSAAPLALRDVVVDEPELADLHLADVDVEQLQDGHDGEGEGIDPDLDGEIDEGDEHLVDFERKDA